MFLLPLTRETEKLYYNQRMIIDNKVLTEPRTWHITKVNRLDSNGLTKITLAQDRFDPHKDYIELDDNGNVIGMWADYYVENQLEPEPYEEKEEPMELHSEILYAGVAPEVKINGSYKKLTAKFYQNGEEMPFASSTWTFAIRDNGVVTPLPDYSEYLVVSTEGLTNQQIKIKFIGDASNIGKVIIVTNTASIYGDIVESSVELDIKSL